MWKNRSIRFRITFYFTVLLLGIVILVLFALRYASGTVLRGTIRNYLIATVEENVNKIQFTEDRLKENEIYIPYKDGYLEIDVDFMEVVNDVHTALYSTDGTLLYGENPIAEETAAYSFDNSHTWSLKTDAVRYDLYDRKLVLDLPDDETLWIRGVVSEERSVAQLSEITRLSLIILPVLAVLSVLSGFLLSGRMLAPIRKIESAAEHITGGEDLGERIETGGKRDEVGRLAELFNSMLDRLERSFRTERQFTSDASHELRTPTSVILAETEYTLEKPRSGEEYVEALSVIDRQGKRMKLLIEDMLDYTRMSQGAERYPMTVTDLSAVVKEGIEGLALLGTNNIKLASDVEDGLIVNGNKLLLSRLLHNLVTNAYRYGKEGGWIRVRLTAQNDQIVLSVADNGIGISEEDQLKIFDRFYRSDDSRTVSGTGLGLAMVKRIAEMHEADLSVESTLGEGSTFTVRFAPYGRNQDL